MIGPSLTAVVLVLVKNQGEGWAFFINGISFLFVIVGLFFVHTPFRGKKPPQFAQKLDLLARDPALLASMRQEAHQRSLTLSWDRQAEEVMGILETEVAKLTAGAG